MAITSVRDMCGWGGGDSDAQAIHHRIYSVGANPTLNDADGAGANYTRISRYGLKRVGNGGGLGFVNSPGGTPNAFNPAPAGAPTGMYWFYCDLFLEVMTEGDEWAIWVPTDDHVSEDTYAVGIERTISTQVRMCAWDVSFDAFGAPTYTNKSVGSGFSYVPGANPGVIQVRIRFDIANNNDIRIYRGVTLDHVHTKNASNGDVTDRVNCYSGNVAAGKNGGNITAHYANEFMLHDTAATPTLGTGYAVIAQQAVANVSDNTSGRYSSGGSAKAYGCIDDFEDQVGGGADGDEVNDHVWWAGPNHGSITENTGWLKLDIADIDDASPTIQAIHIGAQLLKLTDETHASHGTGSAHGVDYWISAVIGGKRHHAIYSSASSAHGQGVIWDKAPDGTTAWTKAIFNTLQVAVRPSFLITGGRSTINEWAMYTFFVEVLATGMTRPTQNTDWNVADATNSIKNRMGRKNSKSYASAGSFT